jgi:hypothetical protein
LDSVSETRSWPPLRLSIVATLLLLGIQGWTGDFANGFLTSTYSTNVSQSIGGFFQAVLESGPALTVHSMLGILILLSATGILVVSLRYRRRSVKVGGALGPIVTIVAGLGGYLFVLSGSSPGGKSKQMGGAFLGAYAL